MFKTILIANRGEIACRIIKTLNKMDIKAIAVYSDADIDSLHVRLADEAIHIVGSHAKDSYLNINAIIAAANSANADAIHPGYGFLSENPDFAKACSNAGITFIGPAIDALKTMGSKQDAKIRLERTGVPLIPGYHERDQSDDVLLKAAEKIKFPVLIKAAMGGGGKGMRIVHSLKEWQSALAGARREASAAFGSDIVIIEKYIENPKHIEVQIIADNHNHTIHLFERDCSIQRRYQKIIEEAPAPFISEDLRKKITTAAVNVAKAINYRNAGTVEFIVDKNNNYYFMEMNTRLQVEHPVTELIIGLDLVELQIMVAANQKLPISQNDVCINGHAIECRVYAEDPEHDFMPSIGNIEYLSEPTNEFIRIDTGIDKGASISVFYDPMIAKIIAWGENRNQAIAHLNKALQSYHISGIKTNISFLQAIFENNTFIKGQYNTAFLNQNHIKPVALNNSNALLLNACFDYVSLFPKARHSLEYETLGWHANLKSAWPVRYEINNEIYTLQIRPISANKVAVKLDNNWQNVSIHLDKECLTIYFSEHKLEATIVTINKDHHLFTSHGNTLIRSPQSSQRSHLEDNKELIAPMPATIVAILKNKGDSIKVGDKLMILEAMKMEHTLLAPKNGRLSEVFFKVGAQVKEGEKLVELEQ